MSSTLLLLLVASLAFGAACGLVFLPYRSEIGRARARVGSGGRLADTAAGPIEYADSGTGIPVLSIHGSGGGYDQGLANAADLVGAGFRVIAPSRFGYLGTPVPRDTSPSAQADAHAALLAELQIERAVVVGVSAGAVSAVELALRHPHRVAALILIVPATYAPTSPVAIEASRASRFSLSLVSSGADFAWWATGKIAPSVLIRFIGVPPQLVAAAPQSARDRVRKIIASVEPLSRRFRGINIDSAPGLDRRPLEQITAPTLVVSARDDLFNTLPAAQFAAATIPGARLVVYETGGHLLVGHEQEVRAVASRFLAEAGVQPKQH